MVGTNSQNSHQSIPTKSFRWIKIFVACLEDNAEFFNHIVQRRSGVIDMRRKTHREPCADRLSAVVAKGIVGDVQPLQDMVASEGIPELDPALPMRERTKKKKKNRTEEEMREKRRG